jgi:hypothetical protein
MAYNLGCAGLGQFQMLQGAVAAGHWSNAASDIQNSAYCGQVGCRCNANMLCMDSTYAFPSTCQDRYPDGLSACSGSGSSPAPPPAPGNAPPATHSPPDTSPQPPPGSSPHPPPDTAPVPSPETAPMFSPSPGPAPGPPFHFETPSPAPAPPSFEPVPQPPPMFAVPNPAPFAPLGDCTYTEWSDIGDCQGDCYSTGVQYQTRSASLDSCDGDLTQTVDCYTDPCPPPAPSPCVYDEWEDLGDCAGECGQTGTQTQERDVSQGDADQCTDTYQVIGCQVPSCDNDCTYSDFYDVSDCQGDCGGPGFKTQQRTLLNGDESSCTDVNTEVSCDTDPCTCAYGAWSPLGSCNGPCNTMGIRTYTRDADDAENCIDTSKDVPCMTDSCTCVYSTWANDGDCDGDCDAMGLQTQTRYSSDDSCDDTAREQPVRV